MCSRILRVEFALNNRELVKAEVFREKSVRANGPIKMKEMKGAFSLNNLLVGTVRPPECCCQSGRARKDNVPGSTCEYPPHQASFLRQKHKKNKEPCKALFHLKK